VRELRNRDGPVLLAVGLTLATVGVVAVVAHGLGVLWTAACVLVTLVLKGLTLGPLTSRLGVGGGSVDAARELVSARRGAAEAALRLVRHSLDESGEGVPISVRTAVLEQYQGFIAAEAAVEDLRQHDPEGHDEDVGELLARWMRRAAGAERGQVINQRRRGRVSPEVADDALCEIEGRALRAGR